MRTANLFCAVISAFFASFSGVALAQAWPEKPIRFVISFAPGGVHDTLARVLQPKLTEALGQPIIIENRGGAGGNIAADAVAKSAPDGYTFLVVSEAIATNAFLYRSLNYDPFRDLTPVGKLADFPMALVAHPAVAAGSLGELIALARARPGQLSYGSAGIGSAGHLAGEYFKSLTGIDMVHVPYKGGAPATADLVGGRLNVMFLSVSLAAPQVRQGKLKALAIAGHKRAANLPDVPSTAEAGIPEFEALLFSSMFAPAGTPEAIVNRMNAELGKALRAPDLRQRFADLGLVPAPNSPQEFLSVLRGVGERWGKLIRDRSIRAD
ncbi:MAG: tripartite tricarboxylate transporter substrate binding protein [Betaproteobacteria bacterium]|nr:tripartite tricarboxylate transporter substrate binding protein [Betaproteobacteria bacterium]